MTFRNDNPFAGFDIAEHLRGCIEPYLAGTTSGMPGRSCSHVGEIAWDDCECGQLIVSLNSAYESAVFPNQWDASTNGGARKCGPGFFVFQYTISMLRCAPQGELDAPPLCIDISAAARITAEDAWAVRAGLMCCLCEGSMRDPVTGLKLFENYLVGPQVMVGPMGGCQGSELSVTIGVPNGGYPCGIS